MIDLTCESSKIKLKKLYIKRTWLNVRRIPDGDTNITMTRRPVLNVIQILIYKTRESKFAIGIRTKCFGK